MEFFCVALVFPAVVSAPLCVLRSSPRIFSHLLKGIFVEGLGVSEGDFGTVVIWNKFWIGSH